MARFLIIPFVLCSHLFSQSPAGDTALIKNEILAVLDRQSAGWNNGSVEEYMDGYARSDSLRCASGGSVTYGWAQTLQRYQKRYSTKETMGTLIFSDLDVSVISNDAALVFGKWALQRTGDVPWGLFTLLLRRSGGEWKIVHDHTSSAE